MARAPSRFKRTLYFGATAAMAISAALLILRHVWPATSPDMVRTYCSPEYGAGIVQHDGLKWFRVRLDMDADFVGNPVDGWVDPEGRRVTMQWSTDLQTWESGHVAAAPVSDTVADGTRTTYVETVHPQDAQMLTVDNVIRWERPRQYFSWQYAQSITLLRLCGVVVSLPNNPYDIPADAALLQADLRSAGFAGAEVELNPAEQWWEIRAYDLQTDTYQHGPGGTVSPGYEYLNNRGEVAVANTLYGTYPNPRFFNGSELEPFVIYPKQFVRARISPN